MIEVPEHFRPHIKPTYPENNRLIFEEWFYQNYKDETEREYLPIFFTGYYVNNGYGKRNNGVLQEFINSLDKSKKYFTVVQYDDGILHDLSGLDIKVFGMGGGRVDYPLPLISMPHPYKFDSSVRTIFCNFVGSMTHPIREKIKSVVDDTCYFETDRIPTEGFCKILSQSLFTLCPRGYGKTSFRICEALQYGSIPVYISDEFIFPHNIDFDTYGVTVPERALPYLMEILNKITVPEIQVRQAACREVYENCFTYESNLKLILQNAS